MNRLSTRQLRQSIACSGQILGILSQAGKRIFVPLLVALLLLGLIPPPLVTSIVPSALVPMAEKVMQRLPGTTVAYAQTDGTITIIKNTVGSDGTFTFASADGDLGGLSISTTGNTGSSATFTKSSGIYTITEDVLVGWALSDIDIAGDADDGSTWQIDSRQMVIDLDASENITVTFTNATSDYAVNSAEISGVSDSGTSAGPVAAGVFVQVFEVDYGDLPDGDSAGGVATNSPNYNTNITGTIGASHVITPGLYLGALVDGESGGQPTATADGDDNADTPDDEDGIIFPTFTGGASATITATVVNTTGTDATLYAFIDWNGDGDFIDTNEAISQTVSSVPASQTVAVLVNVPADADTTQQLGARFRLSTDTGLGADGTATDGEVEDYLIAVEPLVNLGNQIWHDWNNDGVLDAGEPGIDTVAVELYRDTDGDGAFTLGVDELVSTTTTSNGGYYTFTNLAQTTAVTSTYIVVITDTNFISGTGLLIDYVSSDGNGEPAPDPDDDVDDDDNGSPSGTLGAADGIIASLPISLTAGSEPMTSTVSGDANWTVDFGVWKPVSLGNRVWYDLNNNGIQDTGEAGIPGVVLELLDSTDQPVAQLGTANPYTVTADANGLYTFTNLISGTYKVRVAAVNFAAGGVLANYTLSSVSDNDPNDDANNSDNNGQQPVSAAGVSTTGISSGAVQVTPNSEPTTDGDSDNDSNLTVDFSFVAYDLGDLPDLYGTVGITTGASHVISTSIYLGNSVDAELNGQPNSAATGDDSADSPDDEDGVTFSAPVVNGTMQITVTANVSGYLSAWIDWTGGGTLAPIAYSSSTGGGLSGAGTMSALLLPTMAGDSYVFDVAVPGTITDTIYTRFRFTQDGTWTPSTTGTAPDGEVEDHAITPSTADWGDLPAIYSTTAISNGASHIIDGATFLGAGVDDEADGQPATNADADDNNDSDGAGVGVDDDEDGITFASPIMAGQVATITVQSTDGFLNAWIDFNGDGDFDDTDEQIVTTDTAVVSGTTTITFTAPGVISDTLYSRFRLSANAGEVTSPDGQAATGEVEDYVLMSLGNRVWLDDGTGGGTVNDGLLNGSEAGIGSVDVELYDATGTTLLASTTTDANGYYTFTGLISDTYVVRIPASEFGAGQPLANHLSSTDSASIGQDPDADADDNDDNGQDSADPSANGISSAPVTLVYGDEPDTAVDGNGTNSNLTVDFGFVQYDWGDLPDSDGVTLNNTPDYNTDSTNVPTSTVGASHLIIPGLYMGSTVDSETDGQPSASATFGDGADEDSGVLPTSTASLRTFQAGATETVTVTVVNTTGSAAVLYGFIDFNGDGDFGDSGEAVTATVATGTNGAINLTFNVPSDANTTLRVGARFRLSTDTNLGADGAASDGEVEDYLALVTPLVQIGDRLWFEDDTDGDANTGTVTPLVGQTVTATTSAGAVYTATTDANGLYTITVPANATYTVTTDLPTGYVDSTVVATDGTDPTNNNDRNHDRTGTTVAVTTTDNLSIDFGFNNLVTFGDRAWLEDDSDGNANTGTITPIAGMTITATDGVNVFTATTDSNGYYSFTVAAGTYTVTYGALPAPYSGAIPSATPGAAALTGNSGTYQEAGDPDVSHPNGTTVTLVAGEANYEVDFAFNTLAQFGDRVWIESDSTLR